MDEPTILKQKQKLKLFSNQGAHTSTFRTYISTSLKAAVI